MLVSEQAVNLGLEEFHQEIQDVLTDEDVNSIRALLERSREVMNLVDLDRRYSAELIGIFKKIAGRLKESYRIKTGSIFVGATPISDIVLTPDAILSFYCDSERFVSKPLESMTSDVLIKVLTEIIPTIESITSEKIQIRPKQTKFQRLAREIKSALGVPVDA